MSRFELPHTLVESEAAARRSLRLAAPSRVEHRLAPSAARQRVGPQRILPVRKLVDRRPQRAGMVDSHGAIGQHVAKHACQRLRRRSATDERRCDVEHDCVRQPHTHPPPPVILDVAEKASSPSTSRRSSAWAPARGSAADHPRSPSSVVALRNTPRPSSIAKTTLSPGPMSRA